MECSLPKHIHTVCASWGDSHDQLYVEAFAGVLLNTLVKHEAG